MLKERHEAYIDWAEFERNQKQLAVNACGKVDGAKSGRGGRALLAGMLCCGRCSRRLVVAYVGRGVPQAVYRCDRPNLQLAQPRCFTFGGRRPDEAITRELLRAVEPMAIEAALQAERSHMEVQADQRRIVEIELQQARYEAKLAERRYAAPARAYRDRTARCAWAPPVVPFAAVALGQQLDFRWSDHDPRTHAYRILQTHVAQRLAERCVDNRIRRVGIVAPARRLVVALQRHLKRGGYRLSTRPTSGMIL